MEPISAKEALNQSTLNLMFIFSLPLFPLIKARWYLTHRLHLLRMHLDGLQPNAGAFLERMGLEAFRKPAADETQSK
jgi:hypothetical protein